MLRHRPEPAGQTARDVLVRKAIKTLFDVAAERQFHPARSTAGRVREESVTLPRRESVVDQRIEPVS